MLLEKRIMKLYTLHTLNDNNNICENIRITMMIIITSAENGND